MTLELSDGSNGSQAKEANGQDADGDETYR
jgi:hypothetical protein